MDQHEKNRMAVLVIGLLAGVAASVMGMLLTGKPLYAGIIGGCISFVAAVFGSRMERQYRASLAERAERAPESDESEITWEVRMNDVMAGRITDRELADIQSGVAGDWRIWLSQLVNLLGVPLAVLDKLLLVVPAIAFWVILAFALIDPNGLIQTFTAIRNASPADIQHGVTSALTMLFMIGFMLFIFLWLFQGHSFGLRNVAREEFGSRLRRRLKIAATGELRITRIADGRHSHYAPDMLGWLRSRAEARRATRERKA